MLNYLWVVGRGARSMPCYGFSGLIARFFWPRRFPNNRTLSSTSGGSFVIGSAMGGPVRMDAGWSAGVRTFFMIGI